MSERRNEEPSRIGRTKSMGVALRFASYRAEDLGRVRGKVCVCGGGVLKRTGICCIGIPPHLGQAV